jgi:Uma2 family endonuclease
LPPPELKHQKVSHRIFLRLHEAVMQAQTRGEALRPVGYHETRYRFPDNSYLAPRVSVTHAAPSERRYLERAPAIAIEILSSSHTVRLMDSKMKIYFEFGALEVWRVDQPKRDFTVYNPDGSHVLVEDGAVTTPLIPGISLRLAGVFGA